MRNGERDLWEGEQESICGVVASRLRGCNMLRRTLRRKAEGMATSNDNSVTPFYNASAQIWLKAARTLAWVIMIIIITLFKIGNINL